MSTSTGVLIIGGGLNGLAAAALLAHHRIDCMVVERHAETSIQYKFTGISPRSMEIFRSLGLEAEIRARRTGYQQSGGIARARNLADPEVQWSEVGWPDATPYSPTQPATCDQNVLEPILRRHAERLGATMRFNTEFEALEQDERQVRARIRDRSSGAEETVAADYLIVADGAGGSLRQRLGIGIDGPGVLQHWMNLIFDTDLPPTLGGKRFTSCFVTDLNATLTPRRQGRWLLALQYFPENGDRPEDFDAQRCRELVARGAGRPDVKAELVDARPWALAAQIAERFHEGRCFLIGDAAHLMPPTGAFGGNSGIHDAHNLAWKLALVMQGKARSELLDSYDQERRPVIAATLAQALARLQAWFRDPAGRLPTPPPIVADYDVIFGQRYDAGAILHDSAPPDAAFVPFTTLSGQPGTRAPHHQIERQGKALSMLDLFGRDFVLLSRDPAWHEAAEAIRSECSLPLSAWGLGTEGRPDSYGIGGSGAVLVRPDGFVAWRTPEPADDRKAMLLSALDRIGLRAEAGGEV